MNAASGQPIRRPSSLRDRAGRLAAGAWLGLAAALLRPELALACAACLREADNRIDFIVTTGILTFLPLIVIGSVVWWLRRRVAAMEAEAKDSQADAERAPIAL